LQVGVPIRTVQQANGKENIFFLSVYAFFTGTPLAPLFNNSNLTLSFFTMKTKQELASELNEVLERNYDAINGYKDAARDVENEVLRDFLAKQGAERVRFGKEIRSEVILLGGNPVEEGSSLGMLHRTWMNFKTNLTHNNEKEVCEECLRGENAALEQYVVLLEEKELPGTLRAELERHKAQTLQAIIDLKLIKDSFA
jgi:uncharacterized protein (TIGR02284 family)